MRRFERVSKALHILPFGITIQQELSIVPYHEIWNGTHYFQKLFSFAIMFTSLANSRIQGVRWFLHLFTLAIYNIGLYIE
jgi:hypothetical protein